jgi:hypothetical protein
MVYFLQDGNTISILEKISHTLYTHPRRGFMDWFGIRKLSSQAVEHGPQRFELQALALHLRWPYGGFTWKYPLAVKVSDGTGLVQVLPVVDITRIAQILSLAIILLSVILMRRKP